MRIVDAHHHLWNLSAVNYPWLMEKGVVRFFGDPAPIRKNYLVADLREDASGYELSGSVHIQVGAAEGQELRETAVVQSMSDEHDLPSAIVAFCDLSADNAEHILREQLAFPAVRGIRQIVGRSVKEDASSGTDRLIDDVRWQSGLGLLEKFGLSFDLQLIPPQIARIAEVLADHPRLSVALCHCGSPWDQSPEGLASWRRGIELLAAMPNVYCKISGLSMFDHHWTIGSIQPIVEACIESFGADRCMFGSNYPVDKLHKTYLEIWQAYEQITAGLSDTEKADLFGDTARRFYRI